MRFLYITGALASEPQVAGVTRTGEWPFGIPGFAPAGVTRSLGALQHSRVCPFGIHDLWTVVKNLLDFS